MTISKYYDYLKCDKLTQMDTFSNVTGNRYLARVKIIQFMCELIHSMPDATQEDILHAVSNHLKESYQDEWFSFFWQKQSAITSDIYALQRFLNWLYSNKFTPVAANIKVSVPLDCVLVDGSSELSCHIPLITQSEAGGYNAYLLSFKAADKSYGGKSVHTAIATDLYAMAAKYVLEKTYPGIWIHSIYLLNEDDTEDAMKPDFHVSRTKKSNVFSQSYDAYYENENFMYDLFLEVIYQVKNQPLPFSCNECRNVHMCHAQSASNVVHEKAFSVQKEKETYHIPAFTTKQKEVVCHNRGPMLVCAGPGSGKTATLIGRAQKLITGGVIPERILIITFTNKAADELLERCTSFCSCSSSPKIATINALGYEILKANAKELGFMPMLLDSVTRMQLVKALLMTMQPLHGFNYNQEYGRYGLYKTVCRKLDAYLAAQSPEYFFQNETALGSDFRKFAETYREIVKENGFITFDEQVTLCNQLFVEHPDVLKQYQNLYQYVMVDEFQDINSPQATFIYALAKHGNIVAVGDDDQSVYGFRGASNRYMIDFSNYFPTSKTVVLDENFRSTQQIVDASQRLIANNQVRIPKNILCHGVSGVKPIIINDVSPHEVEAVVKECVGNGSVYRDIAILSTQNAPLELLHQQLNLPTVLAKSYLRDDVLFLSIYDALHIASHPTDSKAIYHFFILNGININQFGQDINLVQWIESTYADLSDFKFYNNIRDEDDIYSILRKLSNLINLSQTDVTPDVFVLNAAYLLNLYLPETLASLTSLISDNQLSTLTAMYEHMDYMIKFDDETRLEHSNEDAVLLITSHESKGREFPVVIMINDYKEESEESRRLFYVSMTRAKEHLYILQKPNCNNHFLKELAI